MGTTTELKQKTLKVKVAADVGERTIVAVVSSSNFDRDYERVDVKTLRLPLKGGGTVVAKDLNGTEQIDIPMLLNHSFDVEDVIGSVRKAYLNESGELVVEFGISGRAKAQDLMHLIDEKHLDNAFSVTMSDYQYSDDTIYNAEIIEISMVFRSSNKDARVLQVKSLIKGEKMSKLTLDEKKAELERLQKEISEDEKPVESVAEVVEETPVPAVEPLPGEDVSKKEVAEPEEPVEKSIKVKKEKDMSKDIAVKQVKDVPEMEVTPRKAKATADEQRSLFVKQFIAYKTKNSSLLKELNHKAMEMDGVSSKAITYDDASALYQTEVVSTDILTEYNNIGRLGALVNKVDIMGATQWKRIVEASGNGFQPVGIEESKQEDKPTWTPLTVLPKEHALIVAWYDAIARETPIAVYQQVIRYIADEYAKLEDKIIISFAGVTTGGGDTFASTGLVPALVAGGRIRNVADFSAANVALGIGGAYGMLETDKPLTMVANRQTWGRLAVVTDADGRAVFTNSGQQVTAGALGAFNVVVSQEVPNGNVVLGAMNDYDLVTRGGLETLFSREATVGALNLFTDDASAVRACCDIAGKAARLTSFVLIDFVPVVS